MLVNSVWDIIANKEVIRVNQAWAGHPGRLVTNSSTYFDAICARTSPVEHPCQLPDWQVWAKPMPAEFVPAVDWKTGATQGAVPLAPVSMSVLVVNNANSTSAEVTIPLASLGMQGPASMRDLWAHTNNGTVTGHLVFSHIPPHGG